MPRRARGRRRSTRPRASCSTTSTTPPRCSGCRPSATSTRGSPTRRTPCWRSASRRWRAAPRRSAVASGHAAEFLTMHALMQPGDEFVAANKLYGGSINQFNHSYKNFGWNVAWADTDDPASFEAAITPRTKAIFCESIANPGGVITDIAALSRDRQAPQHPAHRRQHDGDALPDPALRARGRHRRALGDQVPRRPRQLDRRPRSSTAARSSGRATTATR